MQNLTQTHQNYLPPQGTKIAVGMSGGVDSSVTALILKQKGYDVVGIFMKNWEETFAPGYCSAEDDIHDAKDVCDVIGIPLHTVNFVDAYQQRVFQYFLSEYKAGRTPNPDVLCNREIKFAELLNYTKKLGFQYLATGHYAKRSKVAGKPALICAHDSNKDQTYFLNAITSNQLSHALFPLGDLPKPDVRKIAEEFDLITFDKKDSTGICFIGERNFREFLQQFLPAQPGDIVTETGDIIGGHEGLMYYTMGQRQGLGIGGLKNYDETPWFVSEKTLDKNQLIVVQGTSHNSLFHKTLFAGQLNWLRELPENGEKILAKTRYRQPDQHCVIYYEHDKLRVEFETPQRAITLGQYVVFYRNEECLGGGVIEARYR